jgi:hypothetical protein
MLKQGYDMLAAAAEGITSLDILFDVPSSRFTDRSTTSCSLP